MFCLFLAENVGVGEREGRVASELVARRHFRLSNWLVFYSLSLSLSLFFFFFQNSFEVYITYNKRATETRNCIHMLDYNTAQ